MSNGNVVVERGTWKSENPSLQNVPKEAGNGEDRQNVVAMVQQAVVQKRHGQEVRLSDLDVGEGYCQGDVKVQYLGDQSPKQAEFLDEIQVGNQTQICVDSSDQGDFASHFMQVAEGLRFFRWAQSNVLTGPVVLVQPDAELLLTHNEHQHVRFTQPGWYVVRFDRQASVTDTSVSTMPTRRRVD